MVRPNRQDRGPAAQLPWVSRWLQQQLVRTGSEPGHSRDRRAHPRWPLNCPLYLIEEHGRRLLRCQTEDLSAGGAYIRVPDLFQPLPHQIHAFRLMLQHRKADRLLEHLDGEARVVRVGRLLSETGPHTTMALQFTSRDVIAFLRRWPAASGCVFR